MPPTQHNPTDWLVRMFGDPKPRAVPAPAAVLDGLREGEWETTDEVRGPGERLWVPIEEHPAFADAVAEMGPPPREEADETTLDMNPLIDVALVLLIFFILTATVATLRRTIELPPPQGDQGQSRSLTKQEVEDRSFTVNVTLDEREQPVVKISTAAGSERVIAYDDIEKELADVVKSTGRKEMILRMSNNVLWESSVRIYSAATEAGVRAVHMPEAK